MFEADLAVRRYGAGLVLVDRQAVVQLNLRFAKTSSQVEPKMHLDVVNLAIVQLVMLVRDQVERALLVTGERELQQATLQVDHDEQNRIGFAVKQNTVRRAGAEVEMQQEAGGQFVFVFGEL